MPRPSLAPSPRAGNLALKHVPCVADLRTAGLPLDLMRQSAAAAAAGCNAPVVRANARAACSTAFGSGEVPSLRREPSCVVSPVGAGPTERTWQGRGFQRRIESAVVEPGAGFAPRSDPGCRSPPLPDRSPATFTSSSPCKPPLIFPSHHPPKPCASPIHRFFWQLRCDLYLLLQPAVAILSCHIN